MSSRSGTEEHARAEIRATDKRQLGVFIVAPYILIYVQFTHQQKHFFILKNTLKFTLKYT